MRQRRLKQAHKQAQDAVETAARTKNTRCHVLALKVFTAILEQEGDEEAVRTLATAREIAGVTYAAYLESGEFLCGW
jgi:hypothetical protein